MMRLLAGNAILPRRNFARALLAIRSANEFVPREPP